jgi:aminoglycoside phosphotransferase family enzyme
MKVLDFYKCYRAYVRGKVESFRLDDPNIAKEDKKEAFKRAQKYFSLSHRYSKRF